MFVGDNVLKTALTTRVFYQEYTRGFNLGWLLPEDAEHLENICSVSEEKLTLLPTPTILKLSSTVNVYASSLNEVFLKQSTMQELTKGYYQIIIDYSGVHGNNDDGTFKILPRVTKIYFSNFPLYTMI